MGKITGKEGTRFQGPARCFDEEEAMMRAVEEVRVTTFIRVTACLYVFTRVFIRVYTCLYVSIFSIDYIILYIQCEHNSHVYTCVL